MRYPFFLQIFSECFFPRPHLISRRHHCFIDWQPISRVEIALRHGNDAERRFKLLCHGPSQISTRCLALIGKMEDAPLRLGLSAQGPCDGSAVWTGAVTTTVATTEFIRSGRVHALAVASTIPSETLPDVPTAAESRLRDQRHLRHRRPLDVQNRPLNG